MLSILATLSQEHGGLAANVIYIDTEAAFSATRCVNQTLYHTLSSNANGVSDTSELFMS